MKPIAVYDGVSMKRLAYLQNAYDISYVTHTNALWTGAFSMPYSDVKNEYCKPFNLIELWDIDGSGADKYVGLFRIMPRIEEMSIESKNIQYTLEHVFATLLDDVMLGWHEVGNAETTTAQVLNYILDKQEIKRWVLDVCDYEHEYLYGWQDENLLSSIYSVVQPFYENDFYWTFDTKSYPWRVNLRKTKEDPKIDIRYRKNLDGIKRTEDPSNLTTRLYCYGYGEGDNVLNIRNVNDDKPYLESKNISKYGVITQIWTDSRITIEETLKALGESMLEKLEEPAVTYELNVQVIRDAANLSVGDTVRVVHGLLDEYMIVQGFSKDDVSGAPYEGKVVLGAGTNDLGSSVADLAERQRISEMYSQGTESIFMDSLYDNADNANPMETTFTIPENAVHVNEIRFSAKLTNFRAYSKATMGGGQATTTSTEGGSTTPTSSSGGGGTTTSSAGGSGSPTSSSGGGSSPTTDSGGGWNDSGGTTAPVNSSTNYTSGIYNDSSETLITSADGDNDTGSAKGPGSHRHSGPRHTHRLLIGTRAHDHKVTVPNHYHYVGIQIAPHSHKVTIPNHTHTVSIPNHTHTVVIPSHTHTVVIPSHTHKVTIPNHTHAIEYGIYRGPIASQMTIYLDDKLIGTYPSSVKDLNLIDYMSKNENGEVMRGVHTIKMVPSSLTRIECSFQIRMFTNARGSGQH